ncbi:MAG TPA: GNAT family N-acetyltransferase [Cyclobacteriaceae bacterium]|nr:GNAT family N-acetyltransferase [Cyclobacteriaceae bacterium]
MIVRLNHRTREVAEQIDEIQKESYHVEALLIGYPGIPYLTHDIGKLLECNEIFLGFMDGKFIAGLLSYENLGNGILDICRLAVSPKYFRKGIASNLVLEVEKREPGFKKIFVQTARENQPAANLYLKSGYRIFTEFETPDGLPIIRFIKEHFRD